jgi:hypothetical protein
MTTTELPPLMQIICDGLILVMPSGEQVDVDAIRGVSIGEPTSEIMREYAERTGMRVFQKRVIVSTAVTALETDFTEASMATACEAHRLARSRGPAAPSPTRVELP